jgi:hypothetical protein
VQDDFKINEVILDKASKNITVTSYSKDGFHDPDLIIETNNLRCFNGCRAPKKKRKKGSKKWRILK